MCWRLQSSSYRLLVKPFVRAQIKENITAPRHWLSWGESTGGRWIPIPKGPVKWKMFPFWWRHHALSCCMHFQEIYTWSSIFVLTTIFRTMVSNRNHFVYASSQWETTLHCDVVSHWLGACGGGWNPSLWMTMTRLYRKLNSYWWSSDAINILFSSD